MCYKQEACGSILCQQARIVNILATGSLYLKILRYAISQAPKSKGEVMAQHFLLSAKVRDFCPYDVVRMSEDDAFWHLADQRWGSRTRPICPECDVIDTHYFRQDRKQWRCRHCDRSFSVMSGTVFADHKLSYHKMLLGMSLFVAGAKGVASTHFARQLDVQVRTAHMFTGKLRECLLRARDTMKLDGEVHIDGGHFGGKPRKKNVHKKPSPEAIGFKVKQSLGQKQTDKSIRNSGFNVQNIKRRKKRRIVMVLRAVYSGKGNGGGKRTIVSVAMTENEQDAKELAERYVDSTAIIMTDENPAYNSLSSWWEHHSVNHSEAFSTPDGVNENQAESYFSRLRRSEYGTFHRLEPKYLMDIANEMAWREDVRRLTEGEKLNDLLSKVFRSGFSRWWRGYYQGHHREMEFLML